MAHITAQITEEFFARLLTRALSTQPSVTFSEPAAGSLVWFGATGKFHIAGCDGVEFEDGDTFLLSELDLAWEQLNLELGLDIPSFEVGACAHGPTINRWPARASAVAACCCNPV